MVSTPLYSPGAITAVARGIPHPEGIACDSRGWMYTGSAMPDHNGRGAIYRISPDGATVEPFSETGGRVLGIALDGRDNLYVCDASLGALFHITPEGQVRHFADHGGSRKLQKPNFLVFDGEGNLYVSDSGTARAGERTGAIFRFTPAGKGELFLDGLIFANGLALAPDGKALYVVETRDNRVLHVPIRSDGKAGEPSVFVSGLANGPDGLAFDCAGNLYITITRPSRILRVTPSGRREEVVVDREDHVLKAPSNVAFGGEDGCDLLIANLFGDHISRLRVETPGHALYRP